MELRRTGELMSMFYMKVFQQACCLSSAC